MSSCNAMGSQMGLAMSSKGDMYALCCNTDKVEMMLVLVADMQCVETASFCIHIHHTYDKRRKRKERKFKLLVITAVQAMCLIQKGGQKSWQKDCVA